jgi:tRNA (guanine-N7-)-methyltransferase
LLHLFKYEVFDRLYFLFPDPWTKKRHKSRRLLSSPNIEYFSKILKSKGYICIATDVEDYFLEIEDTFSKLYQFQKLHVLPKEKKFKVLFRFENKI